MRKYISHSCLLRWSIGAFLLAASHLPSAVGGTLDIHAIIYVTNNLSCSDTNFLKPHPPPYYVGDYSFFITSGSIYGNAAAYTNALCGSTIFPTQPGFGQSGPLQVGTAAYNPITSTAEVGADAFYNPNSCLGTPGAESYYPYSLSGYLNLANSETYYLSPFVSGPVIPLGLGDPNFPAGHTQPYGTNFVTDTEIPGVISFSFQCTNSGSPPPTLPLIQISSVYASTSPNLGNVDGPGGGTLKASLPGFTYTGPISLLVRSGNAYTAILILGPVGSLREQGGGVDGMFG